MLLSIASACQAPGAPSIVARAEASQETPGTWTPSIDAPVVDLSGRLSAAAEQRLTETLEAHRRATGVQIAVLLVDTLGGEPIEDFSLRVAESWGGGSAGRDDGLLVTFAAADRRMRIEVGYGLEAQVPDALAKQILDDAKPDLRASDWDAAVGGVVRALVAQTVSGAPAPSAYVPRAERESRQRSASIVLGLLGAVLAIFAGYATGLGARPAGERGRKRKRRAKEPRAPTGRKRLAYRLAFPTLLLALLGIGLAFELTAWTLAPAVVYGLLGVPFGRDPDTYLGVLKFFSAMGFLFGIGPALVLTFGDEAANAGLAVFAAVGLLSGLMGLGTRKVDPAGGGGTSYSGGSSSYSSATSASSSSYGGSSTSSSSSSYAGGGGSYGGGGASASW